jgi:hypothetical protein
MHVIVKTGPLIDSAPLFWTGSGWSSEFPDAEEFPFSGEAVLPERELARQSDPERERGGILIRAVRHWGTDREQVAYVLVDTRPRQTAPNLALSGAIGIASRVAAALRAQMEGCIARDQLHVAERLEKEAGAVELLVSVARAVIRAKTCPGCGWVTDSVSRTINCRLGSNCMCGSER